MDITVFSDATFLEACSTLLHLPRACPGADLCCAPQVFFQQGRVAMTATQALDDSAVIALTSTTKVHSNDLSCTDFSLRSLR